jgi:hypothetical protein
MYIKWLEPVQAVLEKIVSQCLIGPGVMQRCCHVNQTIKNYQNWTMKTEVASLKP